MSVTPIITPPKKPPTVAQNAEGLWEVSMNDTLIATFSAEGWANHYANCLTKLSEE